MFGAITLLQQQTITSIPKPICHVRFLEPWLKKKSLFIRILQNVFIYDINGYFRTHNVCPWIDSCQSIKTIGIAQIAIELMELIVKHQNYVIQKQYHCLLT